jgi:anti-sigma regulatory factor (Ser/Thr protein kinase)
LVAELSLRITGGVGAPAEARKALREFHPELAPELMQVIVLLASELVSNAVQHGGSKSVAVRFEVLPQYVRVEVADEGPGFKPGTTRMARHPGGPGGWGLRLVDEMADRWGAFDGDQFRVWFELDRLGR